MLERWVVVGKVWIVAFVIGLLAIAGCAGPTCWQTPETHARWRACVETCATHSDKNLHWCQGDCRDLHGCDGVPVPSPTPTVTDAEARRMAELAAELWGQVGKADEWRRIEQSTMEHAR